MMEQIFHKTILDFISSFADKKTFDKGRRIYESNSFTLKKFDSTNYTATYSVESDSFFNKNYKVVIKNFLNPDEIEVNCNCLAADTQLVCKHGVAALMDLGVRLLTFKSNVAEKAEIYKEGNVLLNMSAIDEKILKRYISKDDWIKVRQLAYGLRAKIEMEINQTVSASLSYKNELFNITIQKISDQQYATSCNCIESQNTLCLHRAVVFMQLYYSKGPYAFEHMKDWTERKNKLLADYGFSLEDDLTGKFSFFFDNENLKMKVLDKSLIKLKEIPVLTQNKNNLSPHLKKIELPVKAALNPLNKGEKDLRFPEPDKFGIGYVFDLRTANMKYPYFGLTPITGKIGPNGDRLISHISSMYNVSGNLELRNMPVLDEKDIRLIQICQEISAESILNLAAKKLKVNTYTFWGQNSTMFSEKGLTKEQHDFLQNYVKKNLEELFMLMQGKRAYLNNSEYAGIVKHLLEEITLMSDKAVMSFLVCENNDFIELQARLHVGHEIIPINDVKTVANFLLISQRKLMIIDDRDQPEIFKTFIKQPLIKVKKSAYPSLFANVIAPLQSYFEVENKLTEFELKDKTATPQAQLYLKENEDYLILQPIVDYGDVQVELDDETVLVYSTDIDTFRLHRDGDFEQHLKELMLHLHPNFIDQYADTNGLFFYLSFEEVMVNGWILNAIETLKNKGVEIFGLKSLTKFKYNVNKPTLSFSIRSGIDWFDIHAEIQFGELSVSLKEVQKSIIRKENFVKLSDGTLGILPEEWIKRYAAIFKMGDVKGKNEIKISKLHFSVIDELYQDIDQESVLEELREKKEKLKNFNQIQQITIPAEVSAELRPYQKAGFNWLNFLHEFSWGGCLADDMGLGKTLQVLTFLQHLKSIGQHSTNLVVVPTSLIFNWEAEVEKFCPGLKVLRYHGTDRFKIDLPVFEGFDIVLTTYGTLASDIEKFMDFTFNYLILDESQAIKNPETKRYKSAMLLKARNRIAMTGTPIENNTFDLFAQLNFLNPGMLGSIDFFKEQYSNPIDKQNDADRIDELKRIVHPFILRRTKEVVAQELPEKTETILYCQMGSKQRKVYEAFKDRYRDKILEKIDSDGISRAGIYILEGLMKLRQICDSPELLKDSEDYGAESVKLTELLEHISEHTGKHKILVFSQFLGMLSLIRNQLQKRHIGFTYLTGATTPAGREEAVRLFQTNPDCRVFLISLKAGGTGLNLTAADYVFLVDPWWNPAVEQQAIDRTHRIGQTNHVFAYKMICKDTVEEKILALQLKKKTLAADLIGTDKGFIKSLTKSDVLYLFS
ncbi:MAG: DEAD/DEAH box helicase [Sphingobacteriales bacterium]|nr:MAG: DEAD/DEAH box helicase [Sphingobacteriales bacterium]